MLACWQLGIQQQSCASYRYVYNRTEIEMILVASFRPHFTEVMKKSTTCPHKLECNIWRVLLTPQSTASDVIISRSNRPTSGNVKTVSEILVRALWEDMMGLNTHEFQSNLTLQRRRRLTVHKVNSSSNVWHGIKISLLIFARILFCCFNLRVDVDWNITLDSVYVFY